MASLRNALILVICMITGSAYGQSDTTRLQFTGDLRFRIEQDWNARKSDGTFREDRSRLRYRFRFGVHYQLEDWLAFGGAVCTGDRHNPQDPNITLGLLDGEFSNLEAGLSKVYIELGKENIRGWLGKNTFPFVKQNEMFWSGGVQPEGVAMKYKKRLQSDLLNTLELRAGHFIIAARARGFGKDTYFQGLQLVTTHLNERVKFFPGIYYFKDLADIPDNQGTYTLSYSIAHLGFNTKLFSGSNIELGLDYYLNFQDYDAHGSIPESLKGERIGFVIGLKAGQLKQKGDWTVHAYYARIERFSVVDYFAQFDWQRWDYSGNGAKAARASNFEGYELRVGYAFHPRFNVVLRGYRVRQLVALGSHRETGSRARIDLNVGF